ncbi:restriction endonuclease subunit S [Leuconostoc mesenteroides]|uniref:restriction endonuclease subunit S n=1 Tax=Leuconostoc mesenteroides TaxID=1245 RepID=UPI001CBFC742|nr:restriction endonuclease subunit S [Leuconostoc mesenteroides]MBZ1509545.1 restriction endonuclease subunit S [Leuconostoc mesenteroides]MBZ1534061.1 restriction endonuclease subunit S [Leuconostoc mesenteroides]
MAKIDDSVKKKVPELRFKGFTDEWEQRKLEDEVRIVMGQSPNSENYTDDPNDYILVQGNADMKNGRVLPRVWTTQVTKQAEKDDLILSVRAPVGDIGKTAYDVVIGRGVAAIKGNEFIFQNLGKMKSDGYWTRYSTGSTFESINSTDIKEAIISVPAIEEQDKIGSFFKQLDNTIALHQRKLDLLKEQKKGYLQKMFPKNGAKVPELRFAGFADDWEERKLSEIGKIVTGNTPSTSNKGYYNGDFLFVSPADIQENRYVNKTTTTLTELGFKTGRLVPKGATLFVSIGSTIGKIGQSICDVITNQQINSVISFSDYDDDFIYTSILNSSTKIKQLAATQAVPIINKNEFGKSIIKIPSLEEQQKIGAFFKQLDDTIALHQRKLDLLKEQKKGFLQKMFV